MSQNYLGSNGYGGNIGNVPQYSPYPPSTIPGIAPPMNYQDQSMTQSSNQPILNGRLVENANVLKGIDIPIGGYGVFPRLDFEEIYIKTWSKEGKPDILVFKFDKTASQELNRPNQNIASEVNRLYTKVDELTQKLNSLLQPQSQNQVQPQNQKQPNNDIPNF